MLLRYVSVVVLFATVSAITPAFALDAKQKRETCEFGAEDQKLAGAERKKFISKCMANEASPKRKKAEQKK